MELSNQKMQNCCQLLTHLSPSVVKISLLVKAFQIHKVAVNWTLLHLLWLWKSDNCHSKDLGFLQSPDPSKWWRENIGRVEANWKQQMSEACLSPREPWSTPELDRNSTNHKKKKLLMLMVLKAERTNMYFYSNRNYHVIFVVIWQLLKAGFWELVICLCFIPPRSKVVAIKTYTRKMWEVVSACMSTFHSFNMFRVLDKCLIVHIFY